MTPALLFPLGLAALAGVLMPLVIHLARRTEQHPTDFAALRWLRQKPRPRHRPRFDERLLLATRLLLLTLAALVLAQPVLSGIGDDTPVIAVVPGVAPPAASEARRLWLAPGFPGIEAPPPTGPIPVGSLIRQLDAELPPHAPLTMVVPRIIDGADAERPRVSRPVNWRIVDALPPSTSTAIAAPAPALRYDPATPGARYLRAAVTALGRADIGVHEQALPKPGTGLIWLAAGPLPERIRRFAEAGATVLVARDTILPAARTVPAWRDGRGQPFVEAQPLGRGHVLRFVRTLSPAAMPALVEPDFPHRLAALFVTGEPSPARVPAAAYAPLPGAAAPPPPVQPLWPWLAIATAAIFFLERWLATRTTRAVAP